MTESPEITDEHVEPAAFQVTDVANAHRIAKSFADDLRWCKGLGWLAWTGTHWEPSETRALAIAERLGRVVLSEAAVLYGVVAQSHDQAKREEISKRADARYAWARLSESKNRIQAALDLARPHLEIDVAKLDADPWLLPVANGALELRTSTFREHRRDDYCTKLARIAFDPTAPCPTWEMFIGDIFQNDIELVAYAQRFFGYCLTGLNVEQLLHFLVAGRREREEHLAQRHRVDSRPVRRPRAARAADELRLRSPPH